jgi:hypothetical protein
VEEQVEQLVLVMVENVNINDKVNHQYVHHYMLMIYDNYQVTDRYKILDRCLNQQLQFEYQLWMDHQ